MSNTKTKIVCVRCNGEKVIHRTDGTIIRCLSCNGLGYRFVADLSTRRPLGKD